jgi:hypothetical protein
MELETETVIDVEAIQMDSPTNTVQLRLCSA